MYYRILMRHKVSLIDLEFVSFNTYIELRNMESSLWECNVILSIVNIYLFLKSRKSTLLGTEHKLHLRSK